MLEIRIEPLTVEHVVQLLKVGAVECGMTLDGREEHTKRIAAQYERDGQSLTLLCDGEPLACALIRPLWPGVIEMAAIISIHFQKHRVSCCRAVREFLDNLFQARHLHRIQTTVRCDFSTGLSFVEWLGFHAEGRAIAHSHDQVDAIYYALVRC